MFELRRRSGHELNALLVRSHLLRNGPRTWAELRGSLGWTYQRLAPAVKEGLRREYIDLDDEHRYYAIEEVDAT